MEIEVKIPANLDIPALLTSSGREATIKLIDKMAFICYSLHNSAASHREDFTKSNARPYYPLYSIILKSYVNNYPEILQLLIELGVIETDNHYIVGKKSKGYRFIEKYYGVPYIKHAITDSTLHQSLQKHLKEKPTIQLDTDSSSNASGVGSGYEFLMKYWKKGTLKIDAPAAINWLDTVTDVRLAHLYRSKVYDWRLERKKVIENKEMLLTMIDRFDKGLYNFSVEAFSGRLHTNLTNLKRELRDFISYNGETLVSLDISNAALYFLLALLNQNFWIKKQRLPKDRLTVDKIGLGGIVDDKVREKCINTIMLLKTLESPSLKGFQEIDIFTKQVTRGMIYDDLLADFVAGHERSKTRTRDAIKQVFLFYLFGNTEVPTSSTSGSAVNYIANYYPTITNVLTAIKSKDYKLTSKLIHRVESYLMIEVICKRFSKEHKKVPLFTIHDSIVTSEANADVLKAMMEEELTRYIGHSPKIKREIWKVTPNLYKYDEIEFMEDISDNFPDGFTWQDLLALVG